MSIIIEHKKFKTTEPTSEEMKAFARQFTLEQWVKLCNNSEFLSTVSVNLDKANKIASSILTIK